MKLPLLIAVLATSLFAEKGAKPAKPAKMGLLGKATFFLPQKVIVQDTAAANKVKSENPIMAMAGFKRIFVGYGEVQFDAYSSNGAMAGEISFTKLQQPGLMGPVDQPISRTAPLENLRIDSDTLWFIYKMEQYLPPSKGFITLSKGNKILGISATSAYKIPCSPSLIGYAGVDEKYLTLAQVPPDAVKGSAAFKNFRSCLDSLKGDDEALRMWSREIEDAKFVIDSLKR